MLNLSESITVISHLSTSIIIILLIIPLFLYVIFSYSLYTMAKNRELDYPWLAWIPVVRHYLFGELLFEKVSLFHLIIPYAQILLPVISLFFTIFLSVPLVGWILVLFCMLYHFAAFYRLYRLYCPRHAVVLLILSILFCSLTEPFILLYLHKNTAEEYLQL